MSRSKINATMTPATKASGERLAKTIEKFLPPGHGFALLIFEWGPDGMLSWISNAERDDMIATMKDFIAASEGRALDPPARKQ
jgi:hypothetical protein